MDTQLGQDVKVYQNVVFRNSKIGNHVMLGDDVFITDSTIGNYCSLERRSMIFNSQLGMYSYTGYNTIIKYAQIGKFCAISWNVTIGGPSHEYHRISMHPFPYATKYGIVDVPVEGGYPDLKEELVIGNDVWIAANVCITRGVKIADGAVIGANAVVTKDVGPYEIWAGIPARKIGQRFADDVIAELLKLKWWNWSEEVLKEHVDLFRENITLEKIHEIKKILGLNFEVK